ncbi:uncharacterized protein KQ657_002414 [Scheffersomyces spartinae]|uniref:Uncharacterized protein n=1 Tax=Scheffersomyces spartinae TaxID=45513 RepID=A0A9P8AGW2_9ASCO|nr:uncharacterized protein KQ657_002414 [Scheffersomyces spartinae]KAG7192057.1 hypothetical protein KQ657_002414 [Scheffersomyces spartinae]
MDTNTATRKTGNRNSRRRGPSNRQRRITELQQLTEGFRVLTVNGEAFKDLTSEQLKDLFGDTNNDIYLSLVMIPSDPDFPYEVKGILIHLCVPGSYPGKLPSITLLNDDIPIGYGANIERGFTSIVKQALKGEKYMDNEDEQFALQIHGKTLSAQLNCLDKNLEFFLRKKKQNAVKVAIRSNTTTRSQTLSPQPEKTTKTNKKNKQSREATPVSVPPPVDIEARDKLLGELTTKLPLKLLQRSNSEFRYQIEFPISSSQLPNYMINEKTYRVLLCIPLNYPDNKSLTINPYVNYTKQLILKYKLHTDQFKQFKTLEKNLVKNFQVYNNENQNKHIVSQMNWVANNLASFMLGDKDFKQWVDLILIYH